MGKESKTILELDKLASLLQTDEVPVARQGSEGDNKMILGDLIKYDSTNRTLTIYGNITFDVSSLLRYILTVTPNEHGSVAVVPEKNNYGYQDQLILTPSASAGYKFDHWVFGDGTTSSQNPLNLNIADNTTITAVFEEITEVQLVTGVVNNIGGTAKITNLNNEEISAAEYNGSAKFIATPTPGGQWDFDRWYKNAQGTTEGETTSPILFENITQAITRYAKFKRIGAYDYYIGFINNKNSDSFPSVPAADLIDSSKVTEVIRDYKENRPTIKKGYGGTGIQPLGRLVFYVLYRSTLNAPKLLFKSELEGEKEFTGVKYNDLNGQSTISIEDNNITEQYKIMWIEFISFGSKEYMKIQFS